MTQDLEDVRRREFRRMVGWSVAVHTGVVAVAVGAPAPGAIAPPDVISVDLVGGLPAPARAARPAPPPPPPAPKQVVLPERPSDPKPAKPEPKPKPRRREVVLEPKPRVEKSLDDLLSEFRDEAGETPTPEAEPQQVASAEPAAGATGGVSAELADWIRRVKVRVKQNWVVPPGFRTQSLVTRVEVDLDASGAVLRREVVARSGNVFYDEGVMRSLEKADPLPAPPEPGSFTLDFPSEDY